MKTDIPALTTTEIPTAPAARTNGAARIGEDFYWGAHTAGLALFVLSVVLIVFSRGPRRADAIREAALEPDAESAGSQVGAGHVPSS